MSYSSREVFAEFSKTEEGFKRLIRKAKLPYYIGGNREYVLQQDFRKKLQEYLWVPLEERRARRKAEVFEAEKRKAEKETSQKDELRRLRLKSAALKRHGKTAEMEAVQKQIAELENPKPKVVKQKKEIQKA